ncbi:MAG: hypothetical protein K8I29_19790 [Alphaproteobacteria bacterium]|uniref:Uncharacterized protein n=1 Tax=Candidatus Nitrobium versatile TaxID=2884831 RepID=A0A953M3S9_9BACT|nr:hypothetical protein [Candidatus Nitrobium versatile]
MTENDLRDMKEKIDAIYGLLFGEDKTGGKVYNIADIRFAAKKAAEKSLRRRPRSESAKKEKR